MLHADALARLLLALMLDGPTLKLASDTREAFEQACNLILNSRFLYSQPFWSSRYFLVNFTAIVAIATLVYPVGKIPEGNPHSRSSTLLLMPVISPRGRDFRSQGEWNIWNSGEILVGSWKVLQ